MIQFNSSAVDIFEILSKSISEGIVIVNEDQTIIASNKSANAMFGYDEGQLKGEDLSILIPKSYHQNHADYATQYMGSNVPRQMGRGRDLYGRRKSGETFPIEVGLNPFRIDQNSYVLALVTDISIRKEQENKILKLNSKLGQLVDERTDKLRQIIKDLQEEIKKRKEAESKIKESLKRERELGELKSKFLSMVSHEFKTPLTAILSSATLAGKYTKTDQQDKRDKHLNIIRAKIKSLDNILNDFLSMERLKAGKNSYKFERFPLSRVVNDVIYDANMLSKDGQKINYPKNISDINLYFDEKILALILNNLIHNAIKYSPENTRIDLKVTHDQNRLSISVKDEGIGIPKSEQPFIFDQYFRAANALTNQGTGIGLNIVKDHLEKLDGSIEFNSKEGEGSTFIITIPYQKPNSK